MKLFSVNFKTFWLPVIKILKRSAIFLARILMTRQVSATDLVSLLAESEIVCYDISVIDTK